MNHFKLENEPKINSGFQIPENYFENFSTKVLQQLPEKEGKVIPLFQRKTKWIMAVAAVLLITFFIPMQNSLENEFNELDQTSLENYITCQTNINQYDLIGLLESEDINNIQIDSNIEDKTIEDILSESDVEQILTE